MENKAQLRRTLSSSSEDSALTLAGPLNWKGTAKQHYARSVYGGAGGHNTRISAARYMVGSGNAMGGELFAGNEKLAMQNLNDRLANYLERVRSLEQSNSHLELQIRQWYETNTPSGARDYSAYYKQIEDLRRQIRDAILANAHIVLQMDNVKLATEDFKIKYGNERALRGAVETDLQAFGKVLDDLTISKTDLEAQIEGLTEDLAVLKKEHQEEVNVLSRQLGKSVTVEVDSAPGRNLGAIMNEMRQKYEVLAQENLQKAKEQFELQIGTLQQEVTVSSEELKGAEIQIKELRHTYQTYEIELRSQQNVKESLERRLEETKLRYDELCASIQLQLNALKDQLVNIRNEAEQHMKEYDSLLNIKTRLEQEIATISPSSGRRSQSVTRDIVEIMPVLEDKEVKKTRKIKTVVEEVVDGKVVSSEIKEVEEKI